MNSRLNFESGKTFIHRPYRAAARSTSTATDAHRGPSLSGNPGDAALVAKFSGWITDRLSDERRFRYLQIFTVSPATGEIKAIDTQRIGYQFGFYMESRWTVDRSCYGGEHLFDGYADGSNTTSITVGRIRRDPKGGVRFFAGWVSHRLRSFQREP